MLTPFFCFLLLLCVSFRKEIFLVTLQRRGYTQAEMRQGENVNILDGEVHHDCGRREQAASSLDSLPLAEGFYHLRLLRGGATGDGLPFFKNTSASVLRA